jgi:hypothetical protein
LTPTCDVDANFPLLYRERVNTKLNAGPRPLRPGDVVEVRSAAEIFGTLDADGCLEKMPFMPEMAKLAGRRFTVTRRVDKICDTISATGSRRMRDTVYLDDVRCDGSGHGGCQAGCLIYWKEAWLRRVDDVSSRVEPGVHEIVDGDDGAAAELDRVAAATTRTVRTEGADEVWRCQATDALKATEPLKTSNLAQYWRELRNGNHTLSRFLFVAARGFVLEVMSRLGKLKPLPLSGSGTQQEPVNLDIQPGDLVRVRERKQIAATLDEKGFNRGLSFDREELPYCGRTLRVIDRVDRIIDEKTGRMLNIRKDCLILEGAVCQGERTPGHWFCPRQIHAYWREAWVEPVERAGRS